MLSCCELTVNVVYCCERTVYSVHNCKRTVHLMYFSEMCILCNCVR